MNEKIKENNYTVLKLNNLYAEFSFKEYKMKLHSNYPTDNIYKIERRKK